jgi:predicted nucleic acid-binding protein
MSGRFFLDTNIFVYSFDRSAPVKARVSRRLIEKALRDHDGVTGTQVVQEFLNVALRKFKSPLSVPDCKEYVRNVMEPLCDIVSDVPLYEAALDIHATTGYAFYDSLIIAAALKGGCETLYTEDMQNGQKINDLTIVDPFAQAT